MVYVLTFAFIVLDFITGLIKAFSTKSYSSSVMREGLFHKAGSIMVIVFGALVDCAQGYMDLGVTIPVATTLCIYICLMEIGSIIENLCIINPRIIPDKLKSYFIKLSQGKSPEALTESKEKEADKVDDVHSTEGR